MTRKELVTCMMEELPENGKTRSRLEVECMLEAFGKVAASELLGSGEISIPGLGKLKVRSTSARTGRNPRTGEKLEIPAGRKIVFVPFKDIREVMR